MKRARRKTDSPLASVDAAVWQRVSAWCEPLVYAYRPAWRAIKRVRPSSVPMLGVSTPTRSPIS